MLAISLLPARRRPVWRRGTLEVFFEFLPQRLLRSRPAILHQGADGLPEFVERHRADSSLLVLRLGVAVHPVGDTLLVVGIELEELLACDLVHLLTPGLRLRRTSEHQAAEHKTHGYRAYDPIVSHKYLQWLKVAAPFTVLAKSSGTTAATALVRS